MLPQLPRRGPWAVHSLPHVGREAFSYLTHIVTRYDSLADITVFAQGKPFDHVPDFHACLRRVANDPLTVPSFQWLGFIIDEDDREGRLLFQRWNKDQDGRALDMDGFCQALWGKPAPERVRFYPSAHFIVRAERIRSQPRSFYERALGISATFPDAGHLFERLWDRVFGVNGIPELYRTAPVPIYLRKIRRVPGSRYPDRDETATL